MRFLADESCDFVVVRALRAAGHDVLAVSEITARSVDREIVDQAHQQERILLTEDKDFGHLVFVSHAESAGVILIRFPGNTRADLGPSMVKLIAERGEQILNAFVVVQAGYVRISRMPK